jgi:circadian clock protein KaiC
MMTLEVPDLFRSERLSDGAVSHLSDNVVLLNYIREHDSIKRAVSVIKSRASYHEPDVRTFVIGPDGILLADRPAREELG